MEQGKKKSNAWALPLSMTLGVAAYFIFHFIPVPAEVRKITYVAISRWIQPILLFMMLFFSFIKVSPSELRPHRWQMKILAEQAAMFVLFSFLAMLAPNEGLKVLCEGAMLAFICPTATASAVITGKLGGSTAGVVTYLLICNMMVAVLSPGLLSLVEPHPELDFLACFFMIMGKVFPLLICPLLAAWFVRYLMPNFYGFLMKFPDIAFKIWFVSLALALTVTTRSIVHSSISAWYMVGLAAISLACCIYQFYRGKKIGSRFGLETEITAGQAFGQKNTVFIIWMGLVFLNPVTSVVGGLYSIWHNLFNSYQLYKAENGKL